MQCWYVRLNSSKPIAILCLFSFSNRVIEITGFLYSDYSNGPSLLGIKKPDDNDRDRVNLNKIYGVAVNIKREDQVPITIAFLCRDEM